MPLISVCRWMSRKRMRPRSTGNPKEACDMTNIFSIVTKCYRPLVPVTCRNNLQKPTDYVMMRVYLTLLKGGSHDYHGQIPDCRGGSQRTEGIPRQYLEAAEAEGVSRFQSWWRVAYHSRRLEPICGYPEEKTTNRISTVNLFGLPVAHLSPVVVQAPSDRL